MPGYHGVGYIEQQVKEVYVNVGTVIQVVRNICMYTSMSPFSHSTDAVLHYTNECELVCSQPVVPKSII